MSSATVSTTPTTASSDTTSATTYRIADVYVQGIKATQKFALLTLIRARYSNGSFGYWFATSASSTYTRSLALDSSLVYSAVNYDRRYGFSVRCIAGS